MKVFAWIRFPLAGLSEETEQATDGGVSYEHVTKSEHLLED